MPKFSEIPQYLRANYRINVPWRSVERTLEGWNDSLTHVEMDPNFQRGHVWTEEKQIAYIEYRLRKGPSAGEIQWNCSEWDRFLKPAPIELVDGKQRITAVLRFLHNEIPAFGSLLSEYSDKPQADFVFFVNNLQTRAEVLDWYLQLNSGGVVHTAEELNRVRLMLEAEKATS